MLSEYIRKVKSLYQDNKSDLYIAALIFLVGMASFGLGRLSVLWPKKEPIQIIDSKSSELGELSKLSNGNKLNSPNLLNSLNPLKGKYVASKSGKAYHFPWCAGALKIKEENKIWFQTKEEAESRGYKPAGNCEGL